ncbi:MAG: hypothetical protein AB7G40_16985 [Hyphomonadaceae bacterium]
MKHALSAIALLTLAACGQPAPVEPAAPAEPQFTPGQAFDLACDVFESATVATLGEQFGLSNVVEQTLPGAEGESYQATVLFPDDPRRRLEVIWADPAQTQAAQVITSGDSGDWRGPNGVALGQTIVEIEGANGRPFELFGFGWDYGGTVGDWMGGDLGPRGDCAVRVRFAAGGADASVQGDRPFMSDAPAIRAAEPHVREIALVFDRAG